MKYTADQIKKWEADCMTSEGTWFPARSLNYTVESMWSRIKNAWGVLTGKYDALDWQETK